MFTSCSLTRHALCQHTPPPLHPQIKLRDGIKLAMAVSAEANKFITDTEPFKVVKTDPEHAATLVAACEYLWSSFGGGVPAWWGLGDPGGGGCWGDI